MSVSMQGAGSAIFGGIRLLVFAVFSATAVFGQGSLALSSGSAASGAVALNLTLSSPAGSEPAAIQWTLAYSPTSIASISAVASGTALTAGKSITCNSGVGLYTCMLSGLNSSVIQNGAVAVVTVTMASGATAASIAVTNAVGVSAAGAALPINGAGGNIAAAFPSITAVTCTPTSLTAGGTSACKVTLSQIGGGNVALSSNNAGVGVPAFITVPANATTVTFTATAGTVAADQTATVTASLNGGAKTASITVTGVPILTALSCNPAGLSSGQTSTCTVTVSKAGGSIVSLASTASTLMVPSSVIVPTTALTATFSATATTVSVNQTVSVTATLNGSTQTTSVALGSPISMTGITCSAAALKPGQTTTCVVTLSKAGGATVLLTTDSGSLIIPASVTIGPTSTSTAFSAGAGPTQSDQTGIITASLNGTTKTAAIALSRATTVTGLSCAPSTLTPGQAATCTVTVSDSAGGALAIASNAGALSVPASANVPAGAAYATFTAVAQSVSADQSATVSAALNGSLKSASLVVTAGAVTGLSCSPTVLFSGQSATCMVTLLGSRGGVVSIATSASAVTGPGTLSVPPSAPGASFTVLAGNIANDQTATVTASLNGASRSASIELRGAGPGGIPSLVCNADTSAVGALKCTIQLAQAAPLGGVSVALQSDSTRLVLPQQIQVPAGSQSADFTVTVLASDVDARPQITASVQGLVETASVAITGIRPVGVTCASPSLDAGDWLDCEVRMNATNVPAIASLSVSSNNPQLRVPASITTRPGQMRLPFQVFADAAASQQHSQVTIEFGQTAVTYPVTIAAAKAPLLSLPDEIDAVTGHDIAFTLSAIDPQGLPLSLAAGRLPAGALFDAATGAFTWTPSQEGSYDVSFTATNSVAQSATARVHIAVDSGKPIITAVRNAAAPGKVACSPGSLASLNGRWLSVYAQSVVEPSGSTTSLGGTRVKANGQDVPLVYVSRTRIDFVCPAADPGTSLTLSVETNAGLSNTVETRVGAFAPGLFSVDGSGTGQGVVHLAGSSLLASPRNYTAAGQPAEPGDSITIRATGIGAADGLTPTVLIGSSPAHVRSMQPLPGVAGVVEITVEVPPGAQEGSSVPVYLVLQTANWPQAGAIARRDIYRIRSNEISLAIEPARP